MRIATKLVMLFSCTVCLLWSTSAPLNAQQPGQSPDSPPQQSCTPLGESVTQPVVDPEKFCPEYLVNNLPYSATASITSIAYAPACEDLEQPQDWCGRLFFVRPDAGLLQWVGDFDTATNQYTVHTFAKDLDTPNSLVWHDGAWYVAGDQAIYRLTDADADNQADELTILVDSLPHGAGGWTGSIGIGPDNRLYVSKAASCNDCQEEDPRRGAILSYDLTGGDEQIYASGLHQAFDFAWNPAIDDLWTADSERSHRGETLPLDELNRITAPDLDFGWPTCYETPDGVTADPLVTGDSSAAVCEDTTTATLTFPAHSSPSGIAFYNNPAIPAFNGDLLVVLQGSWDSRLPIGYTVYRVCFSESGELETCLDENGDPLLDSTGNPTSLDRVIPNAVIYPDYDDTTLSLQEVGFYPDHPIDIAISPDGKIAVSVLEGRIIEFCPILQE